MQKYKVLFEWIVRWIICYDSWGYDFAVIVELGESHSW